MHAFPWSSLDKWILVSPCLCWGISLMTNERLWIFPWHLPFVLETFAPLPSGFFHTMASHLLSQNPLLTDSLAGSVLGKQQGRKPQVELTPCPHPCFSLPQSPSALEVFVNGQRFWMWTAPGVCSLDTSSLWFSLQEGKATCPPLLSVWHYPCH